MQRAPSPSPVSGSRAVSADGFVSFQRHGNTVEFRLNYRDAPQSTVLAEVTRVSITQAIDTLRDMAVLHMRRVIDGLGQGILPKLRDDGSREEFVDPAFGDFPTARTPKLEGRRLTVSLPPFIAVLKDDQPGDASERFLAEEYLRAVKRERERQLAQLFEEARRDLLDIVEHAD